MKKILCIMLLSLLPSAMMAASKLPKGTYLWSDFEQAKKEAVENKKPILFVYTDLKTT